MPRTDDKQRTRHATLDRKTTRLYEIMQWNYKSDPAAVLWRVKSMILNVDLYIGLPGARAVLAVG